MSAVRDCFRVDEGISCLELAERAACLAGAAAASAFELAAGRPDCDERLRWAGAYLAELTDLAVAALHAKLERGASIGNSQASTVPAGAGTRQGGSDA